MASEAPATASVPSSSLGPITHAAAAPSLNDTNPSLSKNTTTTEVETNSVTPEPVKVNGNYAALYFFSPVLFTVRKHNGRLMVD